MTSLNNTAAAPAAASVTTTFTSSSASNGGSGIVGKIPSYLSELNFDVEKYPLPTHWNSKDKCSLIELSRHGLRAHYTGSGKSDGEAAAVRSNFCIPSQCGVYYFEVSIISKGRDGYIGIGFCSQTVSLIRLPGKSRKIKVED